jgi:hypothetical protein
VSGVAAPTGFTDYLGMTVSSAVSVVSSDQFGVRQFIEGFNISDLGWGTANAKTVTLSFWVRSSLTGTHSGALGNNGDGRAYPFSYTISVADTWEQKSVTIAGDTSGTWLTNNGIGIKVSFNLGAGSTMLASAGAWTTGEIVGATGSVSVVGTSGATWFVTGCQLEVGTQATSFDYRQYCTELALCQRYYFKITSNNTYSTFGYGWNSSSSSGQYIINYPVNMRAAASSIDFSTLGSSVLGVSTATVTTASLTASSSNTAQIAVGGTSMTTGFAVLSGNDSTSAFIAISSEL